MFIKARINPIKFLLQSSGNITRKHTNHISWKQSIAKKTRKRHRRQHFRNYRRGKKTDKHKPIQQHGMNSLFRKRVHILLHMIYQSCCSSFKKSDNQSHLFDYTNDEHRTILWVQKWNISMIMCRIRFNLFLLHVFWRRKVWIMRCCCLLFSTTPIVKAQKWELKNAAHTYNSEYVRSIPCFIWKCTSDLKLK